MDGSTLISEAKRPTTPDVTSGVLAAIDAVQPAKSERAHVQGVMLGTTHFTNALLERRGLTPTAVRDARPGSPIDRGFRRVFSHQP